MRKRFRMMSVTASTLAVAATLAFSSAFADEKRLAEGKKLAFDIKFGNCVACHMMDNGDQPGNIAPPLVAMKARFPDKAVLRAQIADARDKNPGTIMPPFLTHGIVTEEQLDKIVDYIHSL